MNTNNAKNDKNKQVIVTQQGFIASPLPPPEWLEKFNKIYPNATKEIFEDFKKVSEINRQVILGRMENEKKVVELQEKELNIVKISQYQAFVIACLILICAIICIFFNRGEYAKWFLGLSVVGMVPALINKDKNK